MCRVLGGKCAGAGSSAARTRGSGGGMGRSGTCRVVVLPVLGWVARCQRRVSDTSIVAGERSSSERFCTSRMNGRGVGVFGFSSMW